MGRKDFIDDLIRLLIRMERGMAEFPDEPLPADAEKGIVQALISFGEEILPQLHNTLNVLWSQQVDCVYVVDILGVIGHASSVPYLIELHSKYASFMSGMAAVQALRNIGTEEVYLYFGNLLFRHTAGEHVFNADAEIPIVCEALGEWDDARAIPFLEKATAIHSPNRMPEIAIRQLAKYPLAHTFLHHLAENEAALKPLIDKLIHEDK